MSQLSGFLSIIRFNKKRILFNRAETGVLTMLRRCLREIREILIVMREQFKKKKGEQELAFFL